jgi:hypothetical protein
MTTRIGLSSYQPTSAADAFDSILGGSDPHVVIGDFLDDWRRSTRPRRETLIKDPPAGTNDPTASRWAAFFAAMVDLLAHDAGISRPAWVAKPEYVLRDPWFLFPGWPLRAWQLTRTPVPFRLRNIFGGEDLLTRV